MTGKEMIYLKNWAVIGDVANSTKYAARILALFNEKGYEASGVHPRGGDNIYKTLAEVPHDIEAIDLCINPIAGLEYMKEAKALNIKYVLIQPGAESKEIIKYCKENDITAIRDCALIRLADN